jgi:hypothetical protein
MEMMLAAWSPQRARSWAEVRTFAAVLEFAEKQTLVNLVEGNHEAYQRLDGNR